MSLGIVDTRTTFLPYLLLFLRVECEVLDVMGNYKRNEENKKDSDQCGIYSITNILNGKRYIGQTYNFKYRWMRHRSCLKHGTEHNAHLQAAWSKYGADNFKFEIIERCPFKDLDDREIYWINYYDSKNTGYNFADGGLGCKGYKHSQEEIMKMRMIQNPEPILQIDLNGNILNEFVSAGEAGDYLGKDSVSGIKRCCDGDKYKTAYGYIWIYRKDLDKFKLEDHVTSYKNDVPVSQYTKENTLLKKWTTARDAAKSINGSSPEILKVCTGERVSYKGFVWKYTGNEKLYDETRVKILNELNAKNIEKTKTVLQYSPGGTLIRRWNNAKETTISGYNSSAVGSCCAGYNIWYKGSIWIYEEDIDTLQDRIKRLKNSKIKIIPILQYDTENVLIKEWPSINSIQNFSKSKVKQCLIDGTGISQNYIWKYKYPELVS